jgi:hypothetical protein
MRNFSLIVILLSAAAAFGQSGRLSTTDAPGEITRSPGGKAELTVKEMFDEANSYVKARAAEFMEKKVRYTDGLLTRTRLEQRQLAARHAASASGRKDLTGDDLYYLGMLHWIAENYEGAAADLQRAINAEGVAADRRQTARSVTVVALAKQRKFVHQGRAPETR